MLLEYLSGKYGPDYCQVDGKGNASGPSHRRLGETMSTEGPFQQELTVTVRALSEIFRDDKWLSRLIEASNSELETSYREVLIDAVVGMGYCIDDREAIATFRKDEREARLIDSQTEKDLLKPAFVGGAGGWVVMFMMRGMDIDQALAATVTLYEKMNWGPMIAHIDDDHGNITDKNSIATLRSGCGFLGVAGKIIEQAKVVLGEIAPGSRYGEDLGRKILEFVLDKDGILVVVTNRHAKANVVVNNVPGKTINRNELPTNQKAYLFDINASARLEVWRAFCEIDTAGKVLSEEEFYRMQAFMHVATAFALKALDPEHLNNLAVLT